MNAHRPWLSQFSRRKTFPSGKAEAFPSCLQKEGRTSFLSAMAEHLYLLLGAENLAILKLNETLPGKSMTTS